MRASIVAAALAVGAATAADTGTAPPAGAWELRADFGRDLDDERFLREAEIAFWEGLGAGVTRPRRLLLREGTVERRAVLKYVDQEAEEVRLSERAELFFTDSYLYEVAAYRVDRLLGLGMVPVTVLREVDGQEGSVQQWVEEATSEHERRTQALAAALLDRVFAQRQVMHAFDVLIYNIDRNQGNSLYTGEDWRLWLIDHSRSFRLGKKGMPSLEKIDFPLDPELERRMAKLTKRALRRELDGLLSGARVRAILARRDLLLERSREARAAAGRGETAAGSR